MSEGNWICLMVGIWLGTCGGVFLAALLHSAKDADRRVLPEDWPDRPERETRDDPPMDGLPQGWADENEGAA